MPLTIDSFKRIAESAWFSSQDIMVRGQGEQATARLGNYIFSQGNKTNDMTMAAFRSALEQKYGVFGTNAFDSVVGSRAQLHKSLRVSDVKATLSRLETVKMNHFTSELSRQLDTSPKFRELSDGLRQLVRSALAANPVGGSLNDCTTPADLSRKASARIDEAIQNAKDFVAQKKRLNHDYDVSVESKPLQGRRMTEKEALGNEPTGLRNLKLVFKKGTTSVEDQIRQGTLGSGMRINRSNTHPVLLEKLKTNGVEPGFIYRNDWSKDDTRGYMANINSPESKEALDKLKKNNPALAEKCAGKDLRAQILLAGRAHPAAMAAASELVIERAMGEPNADDTAEIRALRNALAEKLPQEVKSRLANGVSSLENQNALATLKKDFFVEIRDAVMSVGPKNADGTANSLYNASPVFRHFSDRAIVKLDYNEGCKFSKGDCAHAGTFMRPERIIVGRKMGQIYRFQTRTTADKASAGAVTEALANDLTRIAGVPSQELEIVRGQYSDGHPKIMLSAKFANGYKDMEAGMLKDGRIVRPNDAPPDLKMESLGKYKAFFLVTADRDGVGSRGQNKGFVNGKFFAIDPGHSLEGNGKYLKVSDNLSFKDTYGRSSKPRFNNFSVFDDDTFFSKIAGVVNLRDLAKTGAFSKLFDEYRTAFNPNENGISDAEKTLRTKIVADINKKEAEFNESLKKILDVSVNHLDLYDDLADEGPAVQQGAIETISNLEKLTSPTTWVSKNGKVALNHLEVLPDTRVPWKAALKGDNIVFFCETKMSYETSSLFESIANNAGASFATDALGVSRLVVPKDKAEKIFQAFSEEKVQQLTHPDEYVARNSDGDPIKSAKTYRPVPYVPPASDPRPLMNPADLPEMLHVPVAYGDKIFSLKLPKIHYQGLVTDKTHVHRPRNEGELRYLLECQIRRGNDVLGALMSGKPHLFEPTRENIVALTYALHAAALRKGEFMYRGSFSIEDKNGDIARWLDRANDVYLRTSTHAKPYQQMKVDGHLNMPRGYDVPNGAGGLLNGMRTFHYFTIPDTLHLHDAGGSGPRRRLFLKCETFGIFASTAHFHPFNKSDAKSEGMQTRGYRPGDIFESIRHGASLINSLFTPKEAPGIRKENLTTAQKTAIQRAVDRLKTANLSAQAELLIAGKVLEGSGIRTLNDNVIQIVEKAMPEDEGKRAELTSILDDMLGDFEAATAADGEFSQRIGNEIMIDAKDLL